MKKSPQSQCFRPVLDQICFWTGPGGHTGIREETVLVFFGLLSSLNQPMWWFSLIKKIILVFWRRICCFVVITAPAICWCVGCYELKLYGLKRFKLTEVWFTVCWEQNVFTTPTAEYRGGVYETIRPLRQEMLLLISDAESVGGNKTCVLKDSSTLQIQLWIFYPRLCLSVDGIHLTGLLQRS